MQTASQPERHEKGGSEGKEGFLTAFGAVTNDGFDLNRAAHGVADSDAGCAAEVIEGDNPLGSLALG